jgi:hypothetical protein
MPPAFVIEMPRRTLLAVGLLLSLVLLSSRFSPRVVSPQRNAAASVERTPVCPWRQPQRDLPLLFPPATNYVMDTRVLSGMMLPIQRRLGRAMTVDENPLRIFHIKDQDRWLGDVLLCRVKGEHGGIEIVMGIETNGTVRRVLIQSQREPESVARIITDSNFLRSFVGKDSSSSLRVGDDLPDVVVEARDSAQAIADGVRSQLIVLTFAGESLERRALGIHRNH